MVWDPTQYLRFDGHRIRPAIDLLHRIGVGDPARVVDLGCGTGNTTALLAERWPDAEIIGVDNSPAMLAVAEHDRPDLTWIADDITAFEPGATFDLAFSNAALHWIGDHDTLLPKLFSLVSPGGCFAMQVPDNFTEPTHTVAVETVLDGPWADELHPLIPEWPVLAAEDYTRLLAPHAATVDAWTTTYIQVLEGENPVAQWTKGSALRSYLSALDDGAGNEFFDAYSARIADAYPPEPDGTTLLPFRRVFVVATVI